MATFNCIPFTTQNEISYPAAKASKDVGVRKLCMAFWSQELLYCDWGRKRGISGNKG